MKRIQHTRKKKTRIARILTQKWYNYKIPISASEICLRFRTRDGDFDASAEYVNFDKVEQTSEKYVEKERIN